MTADTEIQKNLDFWNTVSKTDPDKTTKVQYENATLTAIKPMYIIHKVTSLWGPLGIRWGYAIKDDKQEHGMWFSLIEVWYEKSLLCPGKDGIAHIQQYGGADLKGDNDAAKKSVTDGLMKCLSYLGFGADVHMGLFDDQKYVSSLKTEKAQSRAKRAQTQQPSQQNSTVPPAAQQQTTQQNSTVPPATKQQTTQTTSQPSSQKTPTTPDLPKIEGVSFRYMEINGIQQYIAEPDEGFGNSYSGLLSEMNFKFHTGLNVWVYQNL